MDSRDRKSTRLNSSHPSISYAVFCLKKKTRDLHQGDRQNMPSLQPTLFIRSDERVHQAQVTDQPLAVHALEVVFVPRDHFFFNEAATTDIYTLSLHDALPI